jgi:TPR repeat protein
MKEWYLKATDLGNSNAMNSLGCLYEGNYQITKEWFEKSVALGNTCAKDNLDYLNKTS